MEVEEYLGRSRLLRRLKSGPHGRLVESYAACLVKERLVRHGTWRCLDVVSGLLDWIASRRFVLADLDERMIERYLRHRAGRQTVQPGDRAALRRWLSVLREEAAIPQAAPPPLTPHDRIFTVFDNYLRTERGLAPKTIIRHLPTIRQFLHEVCPAGADDLSKISRESVVGFVERHAHDWIPKTGKVMCWSLRAFLRYLHHQGLNPASLADCVPSMRRWKLATLPTYLSAAQVRTVLDGCDRATVMGRRDYAVLMLLAKLGLRADEVATITLDDLDWRAGELLVRAKGRQRARMPMPPDAGAAIVAYLRDGRPKTSCRRLFVRTIAPHVGFGSGCAITMIAKAALDRGRHRRLRTSGCPHLPAQPRY